MRYVPENDDAVVGIMGEPSHRFKEGAIYVFVIEGRNHLKFWTEAKVKFGRRFEVEFEESESSSPKKI